MLLPECVCLFVDFSLAAFFYSLVSRDTKENLYATKRQRFLVDQGYSFKVVTELKDMENIPDLQYGTKEEQLKLLAKVIATDDDDGEEEMQEEDPFARQQKAKNKKMKAERRMGNTQALTGSSDRALVHTHTYVYRCISAILLLYHHFTFIYSLLVFVIICSCVCMQIS
jgi:cell division protein FtsX